MTVFSARKSRSPICRFVSPSAMSARILRSCSVREASSSLTSGPLRTRSRTRAVSAGSRSDWPDATRRTPSMSSLPRDLLEDVAGGTGEDRGEERLVVVVAGEDQRLDVRVDGAHLAAHVDAAAVGQPPVEDGDVGPQRGDPGDRLLHRAGLAHHLDVALALEQVVQASPDDLVVVEEEDADRGVSHTAFLPCDRVVCTRGRPKVPNLVVRVPCHVRVRASSLDAWTGQRCTGRSWSGVDGSVSAAAALDWAVRQAAAERRPLAVVHACGLPGAMQDFEDIVANERGLRSVGRSIARESVATVRDADGTVAVESVVTMGEPAAVLLDASQDADLMVLGARGRGTVASALLGSVSAVVARESACPVVIVRDRVETGEDGPPRRVVCGVDGTPVSTAAVELAFRMASVRRAPLTLLHATWDLREQASRLVDLRTYAEKVNFSEEEERLVSETVAGLCEKYPDVTVTETYRRGEPVRQLVDASRDASLLVVGTRGRRLLATALLGSVSRGVVERAACPVAVVRP